MLGFIVLILLFGFFGAISGDSTGGSSYDGISPAGPFDLNGDGHLDAGEFYLLDSFLNGDDDF